MNKNIKFIYFDVGGVIILDFSKTNKWREMTEEIGIIGEDRSKFEHLFERYELEVCVGKNLDEFVEAARSELKVSFPRDYSMLDDFVNRFESNNSIHPLLEKIKNKYRLGLLTNMYPGMFSAITKRGIMPNINWEVLVDSCVVGFRKPQEKIYKLAQNLAKVCPEEILFVENTITNVEAAQKRGWQTLLYDPSNLAKSNNDLENLLFP